MPLCVSLELNFSQFLLAAKTITLLYGHILCLVSIKATFHSTISMRVQRATGKIQRNNYHHGSCGPSLTGRTMSVFLIFTQGTHRNVKNR